MGTLFLATTLSDNQLLAILGVIFGLLGIILVMAGFIFIIQIFARWRVFAKMGIASWKCLIPIYSDYCLWGGVWSKKMFWIDLLFGVICTLGSNYLQNYSKQPDAINALVVLLGIVVLASVIALLVFQIMFVGHYSNAFGHGIGFAIGLFFLPSLFELIIGFGASQYVGKKE